MTINISILLATYKRPEVLLRTLESYVTLNTSGLNWEVIVADNDPDGSARDVVAHFAQKLPVKYIHCEEQGKNKALNKILPAAKGEIFVFTDDDAIADPLWLKEIWQGVKRWPYHDVFGGRILAFNKESLPAAFQRLEYFNLVYAIADWHLEEGIYSAYKVFGPNYAVRRRIFDDGWRFNEAIGPSGKNYIMGSETEFLARLETAGRAAIYLPRSIVYHQVRKEQTRKEWLYQRSFNSGRATAYGDSLTNVPRIFGAPRYLVRKLAEAYLSYLISLITFDAVTRLEAGMRVWNFRGQIYQYRTLLLRKKEKPPKKKVLFIASESVFPLNSGGRLRTWNFLQALMSEYEVSLVYPYYSISPDEKEYDLKQFFKNVWPVQIQDTRYREKKRIRNRLKNLVQAIPWEIDSYYYHNLDEAISDIIHNGRFDSVIARYIYLGQYLFKHCDKPGIKFYIDLDDIETIKALRHMELDGYANIYDKFRKHINNRIFEEYQNRNLKLIHKAIVCSQEDRDYILRKGWARDVEVIPNAIDVSRYKIKDVDLASKIILFCGTLNYDPNVDGLLWFARNVFSRIKEIDPSVKLQIIGRGPAKPVLDLSQDTSVSVYGDVPAVLPFYEKASMVIAPIRIAGGTRIKILEAAACRRPVVTTTVGAEGLGLINRRHCIIEDDPWTMARACVEVMNDRRMAQALIEENFQYVKSHYDISVVAQKIRALFADTNDQTSTQDIDKLINAK